MFTLCSRKIGKHYPSTWSMVFLGLENGPRPWASVDLGCDPLSGSLAMSKRLNPHRRLLQAQARALNSARTVQSETHGVEMAKLQQGLVRSGLHGNMSSMTFREPNWSKVDNLGKPKRATRKRFALK